MGSVNYVHPGIRYKESRIFQNNQEGQLECLYTINHMVSALIGKKDISIGVKNLIYYSIFFDTGYVELLDLSLQSIIETSKIDFDLLIITDETTKDKIEKLQSIKRFNYDFHIVSTPEGGVEASKTKCFIFDYSKINDYSKILFLDADIVFVSDINSIFNSQIETNKIYGTRPYDLKTRCFKDIFHGFEVVPEETIQEFIKNEQNGFNAGQFLIKNSTLMQEHFKNVRWFMENWPGKYFFEQCFINYYFAKNASIDQLLFKYVYICNITVEKYQNFNLEKDICAIHFTAPPLEAKEKIKYIKNNIHKFKSYADL